ncbi:methionine--tRNA ligase [Candidatus Bathyarchaeota archaeon]|nr:methionine--tRNA ligase [Candidatus Bathyarchaeota archaeon]
MTIDDSERILVTSALIYANGPVHIGHMVENIQTDIWVRFMKLAGYNVVYCGADDTHGTPIEINAAKQGLTPEEFIDHWWREHKRDYDDYHISFDSYYSTNSPENQRYTELIFNRLKEAGHIYSKEIELTYCEDCGRYLPDRYVKGTCPKCGAQDQYGDVCEKCNSTYDTTDLINPFCSVCRATPIRRNSLHYFFRLSEFSGWLKRWLIGNHLLQPEIRNQILTWVNEGLEDWCISRDGPYFGFRIPGEENKYFYVWLDAPIGYIASTANYCRDKPCTADDYWQSPEGTIIHFIGKDIIYFHLLFWPAVLHSAGFHVPENVVVHGFLTVNGEKMSKSRGTFLTAEEFKEYLDPQLLRYYYAANLSHTMSDIDLNLENLRSKINNELVANLANLFYRVLSFLNKYYDGLSSKVSDTELLAEVKTRCMTAKTHFRGFDFRDAVNEMLTISSMGNKYFQDNKPWELVKTDPEKGRQVLTDCVNIVKNLTILIKPIMPLFAEEIETQLNQPNLNWSHIDTVVEGHRIGDARIVLKKIDPIKLRVPEPAETRKVEFSIDDKLTKHGVDVKLAVVRGVEIKKSSAELDRLKKQAAEEIKGLTVAGDPIIDAYNDVYTRFKIEAESPLVHLINLVKENDRLPTINTVVDAYNIVAATRRVSVGVHDLDKVVGNVGLKVTKGDEVYVPLGETDQVKIPPGKFAMVDDEHVLCWLDVKQGQHTKIGFDTRNLLVYVQGNCETSGMYLENALREICDLIVEYNGGEYEVLNPTDLTALNLKVARVTEVLDHPGADKLYILKIDLGDERRQLCAGLKPYYPDRNDLLGKHLVVLTNLQPARLRGELSEGMLLAGDDGKDVGILNPQASKPGDQVYVGDIREYKTETVTFDQFMKYTLKARDGKAYLEDLPLHTDAEDIRLEKVTDGRVR